MLSDLLFRLRAVFRRGVVEEELDEELRLHVEHQVRAHESFGLTREAAIRRARLGFGGLDQVKEECRQARGVSLVETTLQDLLFAIRGMRRSPVFTLVSLLTLALTIGTISTVFNLANTFFFRRLSVNRPEQLVAVTPTRRRGTVQGLLSFPDYLRFRDHNKTLQSLAAHYPTSPLFVSAKGNAREINGAVVSANFFPLLGLRPALGRFFSREEDSVPDRDRVAVLANDLWRNWFDASPDAIGAIIKINRVPFTVIGVAPQNFRGMSQNPSEIYIPSMMLHVGYEYCDVLVDENCTILSTVGRLAPGRTLEEARAEMATLLPPQWAHASEEDNTGVTVLPQRGSDKDESTARFVRLLFLIAGTLLAVCCANLAGLLIGRGSARSRELAIRASLGAGRFRLMRQLMTESALLALIGGILGTLISVALTNTLSSMFYSMDDEGHPLWYDFSPEPAVILAVLAVSIGAAFLFGLIPAVKSSRLGPSESLKTQASTLSTRSRLGHWLVGTQAALAVALVTVAGLLIGSARALASGISFEPSHVALMRLRPRLIKYSPVRAQGFQHAVIRRLESVAGVESASLIGTGVVLNGGKADVALLQWLDSKRQAINSGYIDIGPRYFETLRTPVLRGREFDELDNLNSPRVAIVNQSLANRLWSSGEVIGDTLVVNGQKYRIVGLVKDVPLQGRSVASLPYVYVPYWQNPEAVDARLCVRVHGDPAAMLSRLAREVNRVDPDVPIAETITLPTQLDGMFKPLRVSATFLSYVAAMAVLLSAIGLYGALAFAVSRRTKEIGIRMAVGAESRGVLTMIVREGMTVILLGACVGIGLAVAGARLVCHLLFGSAETRSSTLVPYCWLCLLACLPAGFQLAGPLVSNL
jgi:predicted permease